ncbi:MAG: histidine phosphatase family protein, partial [Ktedonobacteraceae bacterium]
ELRPPNKAAWQLHDQIIADWFAGKPETTFPGGENFLELVERTRYGLWEATRGRTNQHIVIAAHGGCITALVRSICSNAQNGLSYVNMYNCAITTIEFSTHGDEMSGFLRSWANATHLSGEIAPLAVPVLTTPKA